MVASLTWVQCLNLGKFLNNSELHYLCLKMRTIVFIYYLSIRLWEQKCYNMKHLASSKQLMLVLPTPIYGGRKEKDNRQLYFYFYIYPSLIILWVNFKTGKIVISSSFISQCFIKFLLWTKNWVLLETQRRVRYCSVLKDISI